MKGRAKKRKKIHEKGITPEKINYLVVEEGKRLTKLKFELYKIEGHPAEYDEEEDDNDDDNYYICA